MSGGIIQTFTLLSTRSASNDNDLETILAEIPLFCVGLFAFGVFTFFLVMRRVNLLISYLYVSTLLAFIAGIIDLAVLLSHRQSKKLPTNGATVLRELLFAASIGLRFLFFWTYVAVRPRTEPPSMYKAKFLTFTPKEGAHSAAWDRWGMMGMALKWGLLTITLLITIFQIVWRMNGSNAVYLLEATLELIATGLFVLKLFLNAMISPSTPILTTLKGYISPIIALLLSLGIAAGNLSSFPFSETTLGRFLQGAVVYMLILHNLLATFRPLKARLEDLKPELPTNNEKPRYNDKSFRGLADWQARNSAFNVNPPRGTENPENGSGDIQTEQRSISRQSTGSLRYYNDQASRVSGWFRLPRRESVQARRQSQQPEPTAKRVIRLDDPEVGYGMYNPNPAIAPAGEASDSAHSSESDRPFSSVEDPFAPAPLSTLPYATRQPSVRNPDAKVITKSQWATNTSRQNTSRQSTIMSKGTSSSNEGELKVISEEGLRVPTMNKERPSEQFSVMEYYRGQGASTPPLSINGKNKGKGRADTSPVYGLNGVELPPRSPSPAMMDLRARTSIDSFNSLMRAQTELDKSIASLRLLSPNALAEEYPMPSEPPPAPSKSPSPPPPAQTWSAPASGENSRASRSQSARSDFSISAFPDPPQPGQQNEQLTEVMAAMRRARIERSKESEESTPKPQPVQLQIPGPAKTRERSASPPTSESSNSLEPPVMNRERMGSAGTQYDVTSFIGDLTAPPAGAPPSRRLSVVGSGDTATVSTLSTSSTFVIAQRKPVNLKPVVTNYANTSEGSIRAIPRSPLLKVTNPDVYSEDGSSEDGTFSQRTPLPPTSPPKQMAKPLTGLNARWAGRGGGQPIGLPSGPRLPIGGSVGQRPPQPQDSLTPDVYERRQTASRQQSGIPVPKAKR